MRQLKTSVKTAKGRSLSSSLWLKRQLNDPYVEKAKSEGYRSRAVYKLIELDKKFKFLAPGRRVVDLGAAPGGWSQYAAKKGCGVVAVDLQKIDPINGALIITGDFTKQETRDHISGKFDIVLSDMAPNATGNREVDHLRIISLCEEALEFAQEALNPGGAFVCKIFQGGGEKALAAAIKPLFRETRFAKPEASRSDSSESYIVAMGFKS